MTDISKITGDELLREFAEVVYNVALESRAEVSRATGALRESTQIKRTRNGFSVSVSADTLREKSKQDRFYAATYMLKGYPKSGLPPFNYIENATKTMGGQLLPLSVSSMSARQPSGRRGSGIGTSTDIGKEVLEEWISANKGKSRIIRSLRR